MCWPNCEKIWREQNTQRAISSVGSLGAGASCSQIDIYIQRVQNEINSVNGRIAAGDKSKRWRGALEALEVRMRDAKNLRVSKKCAELFEKQEKQQEITQTSQVLGDVVKSATIVDKEQELQDKIEAASRKKLDYTKIIAIGIGGIFVVAAIVILLKPQK